MIRPVATALALVLASAGPLAVPAHADDARLVEVRYDESRVVRINGQVKVQATIKFAEDEALENVDAMPVEDPQATMPDPEVPSTTQTVDPEAAAAAAAARQQTLQDEGDDAAATAAAALDAMNEE